RDLRELIARERRRRAGGRAVEDRRGRRNGHRLDDWRHPELHRRVDTAADGDDDVAHRHSKARERHGDLVGTWLQTQESEGTVEFGGEMKGRVRPLSAYTGAGDDGVLLVANDAVDAAALGLGNRRKGGCKQNCTS